MPHSESLNLIWELETLLQCSGNHFDFNFCLSSLLSWVELNQNQFSVQG